DNPLTGGGPASRYVHVLITSLPATGGTLKFNGTAIASASNASPFPVPIGQIGLLTFVPNTDKSALPLSTFTFKVQDNGGTGPVTGSGLTANGADTSTATYTM